MQQQHQQIVPNYNQKRKMKKSTNNLNGLEYHRHYGLTNKQLVLLDIGNRNRNRNTGKCVCVPLPIVDRLLSLYSKDVSDSGSFLLSSYQYRTALASTSYYTYIRVHKIMHYYIIIIYYDIISCTCTVLPVVSITVGDVA
jgi:hypothetical protein